MFSQIDLLIINGNIVTQNSKQPRAEAIAVQNGMILAVGSTKGLKEKFSKVKRILDLKGRFLCPGFNDTHTHILAISATFKDVMLNKVKSPKEALEEILLKVSKTPSGNWIFGERWDESNWDDKRYLTLDELDAIAPKNPCYIRRVCGHLIAVNSLALEELGIAKDDPDLDLDPVTKRPLGILTDTLIDRIATSPKLKKPQEQLDEAVKTACEFANSLGVTSVTDNLSVRSVKSYISAWKRNELTIRVYMNVPRLRFNNYINTGIKTGFGDDILRIGGVKIFTDGSIGARTAALKEPYFDDTTTKGGFYIEEKVFHETVRTQIEKDWQTARHSIGAEAIACVLKAVEKINNPELVRKGRHRIEHAEYLLDEQLKKVNDLGLVLSMQPNFPGRWGQPGQLYETKLGPERYKLLNRFRKIIDEKTKLCFGSDNMPLDPLLGIWSVAAHPIDAIRISAEEALYYFTLGAAYSSFEEKIKGSIEIGKLADFVILDQDILNIDPMKIKETKVLGTIFNGKLVFDEL